MMGDIIDTLRADVVMWKECAEERARHYSEALAVIDNTAKTVQAFRQEADKARAEAEKARMDWHAAENELWLGELREQVEKLREQRDRAMAAASGLADLDDDGWQCYVDVIRELADEINKDNETK
jgi:chromosome segregation ATPase